MALPAEVQEARKGQAKMIDKGLYWYGALPSSEPELETIERTRDKQVETEDFFKVTKVNPVRLWLTNTDARHWVGKCRFFQNLGVRGWNFPAFSEIIERGATIETESIAIPYPGAVAVLKADEVERVVKACFRYAVRFRAGREYMHSLRNTGKCELIDLDLLKRPAGWTDAQWVAERQRIPMEAPQFDPDTDVLMAEFVYLNRIAVSGSIYDLFDSKGNLDIGRCVTMLPNQRIDERFFSDPPKSVSSMYPRSE